MTFLFGENEEFCVSLLYLIGEPVFSNLTPAHVQQSDMKTTYSVQGSGIDRIGWKTGHSEHVTIEYAVLQYQHCWINTYSALSELDSSTDTVEFTFHQAQLSQNDLNISGVPNLRPSLGHIFRRDRGGYANEMFMGGECPITAGETMPTSACPATGRIQCMADCRPTAGIRLSWHILIWPNDASIGLKLTPAWFLILRLNCRIDHLQSD